MQEKRDAYDLARESSVRVMQNNLDQRIPLVEQIKYLRFFRFGIMIVFSYCILKFILFMFKFSASLNKQIHDSVIGF